jgi:hypothetical protein
MWPYWLLFLVPALSAALAPAQRRASGRENDLRGKDLALWIACAFVTLVVGLRYEVGADWINYFTYLDLVDGMDLVDVLRLPDPGYQLLNWINVRLDWGLVGVNFMAALLFSVGLITFCRQMPRPWLALAIAVPYLVIVVGMGYTRQATALGLAMIGLVALEKRSTGWFLFWVLAGATFHKTAVLLLPIAALAYTRRRLFTFLWVAVVTLVGYFLFLQEAVDELRYTYLDAEFQSEGAMVRLLMNSLPAAALLLWWKRFHAFGVTPIWRWFAILSLFLQAALVVSPSSTAVDRVALYMLPLQIVVFGYLPDVFGRRKDTRPAMALILAYYGFVQFVWLTFAGNAESWLPYRFYPAVWL